MRHEPVRLEREKTLAAAGGRRPSARARAARALLVVGVLAASVVTTRAYGAPPPLPLSSDESGRLGRGETIIREQTLRRGDRHYVGGVTYTVLDGGAAEIASVLEDVAAYKRMLPRTKSARVVARDGDGTLVEIVQGNSLVQATYTIRVRREPGGREYRFWLDPSRPHGIDDAFGFFRVEPFVTPAGEQRVMFTYGVLVDVGPGLVRDLFEERVRAALLSVPQLVRRYMAEARRPRG